MNKTKPIFKRHTVGRITATSLTRNLPTATLLLASLSPALRANAQQIPEIRCLDGSRISIADAQAFAAKTLAANHVTGAQIAVLDRGRLVWSEAFGHRRLDPSLPMDRETTTWAASITKSVFSTYVMRLVERGEFDLDIPIVKQLPQALDSYEPYRESASAVVRDPAWPSVTPRMLLAHSSGLANFAFIEPDKKMHLQFKPGTRFRYSGEGLNLVQFVIERRKHRTLDLLMQDEFFTPLGMTHTGIIYREEFAPDVADRYDLNEHFRSQTKRFPARAAGSMTTSAQDLSRYAAALAIRSLHEFSMKADEPDGVEGPAVGLAYGVGWGLLTHTRFGPAFFKEGHGDGAQNYLICFQRRQACMIILTNSDNGELAFRPLLETILGDTVTPWEWEGYTPALIAESRKQ